jgi:hypothetical protein
MAGRWLLLPSAIEQNGTDYCWRRCNSVLVCEKTGLRNDPQVDYCDEQIWIKDLSETFTHPPKDPHAVIDEMYASRLQLCTC